MEGARPRPRTVRLGKDIAGLNSDLPLTPTSSVFVRVDEQNVSLWRALITGESSGRPSAVTHLRSIGLPSVLADGCRRIFTEPCLSPMRHFQYCIHLLVSSLAPWGRPPKHSCSTEMLLSDVCLTVQDLLGPPTQEGASCLTYTSRQSTPAALHRS